MSYSLDRSWSDQFIPELCRLIGPCLLIPSTLEQDRSQACDLTVLKARDMTIACRIRRPDYKVRYRGEFTIRSKRNSGAITELKKIINGWGDWFFYGFAIDEGSIAIAPWWLLDLSAFRAQLIRYRDRIRWGQKANDDGTDFCWYEIASFTNDPPLVIASYEPES